MSPLKLFLAAQIHANYITNGIIAVSGVHFVQCEPWY